LQIVWYIPMSYLLHRPKDQIEYPDLERCPNCGQKERLWGHGYYRRTLAEQGPLPNLLIRRYFCPHCRKTVSLLPWFLLPRFQYSRATILEALRRDLEGCKPLKIHSRQLVQSYRYLFMRNMNAIAAALRRLGWREAFPGEEKEKAISLVERLESMLPGTATTRVDQISDRTLSNFMALSL